MVSCVVHAADVQDRDGAVCVITEMKNRYPTIEHLFADGGYAGDKLDAAMLRIDGPTIEIVKRPEDAAGFIVIARRWVVERTFAWLGRCRRLAKDWEKTIASAEAWTLIASIRRSARYIAKNTHNF